MDQDPQESDRAVPPSGKRPRRAASERPSIPGYHLLERIGRGTTGCVYRAVQLSLQREVALKVLSSDLADHQGFSQRFVREAQAAAAVHHPNVVTCYDVGEVDGMPYQAMELLSGGDLQRRLDDRGGRLPYRDAVSMILACTCGLEGIHRAGLMHGDIIPANIFIADDGTVKLADLGLARSLAGNDKSPWDPAAAAGNATAAPEQLVAGARTDIRTDIYALGATLFLLVTGRPPFVARNRSELVRCIRERPAANVVTLDASLPPELGAVIAKAMAKDAGDRYATPSQLREDLERLMLGFTPIHARPPESVHLAPAAAQAGTTALRRRRETLLAPAAPAPNQRRWYALGIGAGLLMAAGALLWIAAPATPIPAAPTALVAPVIPAQEPFTQTPTPAIAAPSFPKPGWAVRQGEDGMGRWADLEVGEVAQRMRWCPPGRFVMGSPAGETERRDDERPVSVSLTRGFWMADSELGQAMWERVMGANPSRAKSPDLPVETVSWHDCQQFLQHLGARLDGTVVRLPTEAEWEYACRAGVAAGTAADGWFVGDAGNRTQPRRMRTPNNWGFHDLGGNVMEWCQDLYGPYPTVTTSDPVGWSGVHRVVRGGAWSTSASEGRAAARSHYLPVTKFAFLGFRMVVNP